MHIIGRELGHVMLGIGILFIIMIFMWGSSKGTARTISTRVILVLTCLITLGFFANEVLLDPYRLYDVNFIWQIPTDKIYCWNDGASCLAMSIKGWLDAFCGSFGAWLIYFIWRAAE